jgi:hypothetical protein
MLNKINNIVNEVEKVIFSYIVPFYKIEQWKPLKTFVSLLISPFIIALTQESTHFIIKFLSFLKPMLDQFLFFY